MYEKWEIRNIVLEGITYETQATLESMCYVGLCSLDVDDLWDLFKFLTSYQWQCKCASESCACPSPPPYNLHAQSPCLDQFRDVCDHYCSSPHDVCSIVNLLTMM